MTVYSVILNIHLYFLQDSYSPFFSSVREHADPYAGLIIWLKVLSVLFLFVLVVALIANRGNAIPTSHWHHHFDNLHVSVQEFYTAMEKEIRDRQMPGLITSRITYAESSLLAAKREYLRVSRGEYVFDICAAPFGRGYFFSWWQGEIPAFLRLLVFNIPFVGKVLERKLYRKTYYQLDTEKMFQESVHELLMSAVDTVTKEKGIRTLTDLERKPVEAKR